MGCQSDESHSYYKNNNLIMKNTITNLRLMPSPRRLPTSQNVPCLNTRINTSFTIAYPLFTLSTAKLLSRNNLNKMTFNSVSQRPESTFMPLTRLLMSIRFCGLSSDPPRRLFFGFSF
jgi:hypothetical protein